MKIIDSCSYSKKNNSTITDEILVSKIISSNNTSLFEILYNRYEKKVYNKCLGYTKNTNEAQDLAQDIFLKLFVKLNSFKGKSKFSTWLYSFVNNHCINYVNRSDFKKIKKSSIDNENSSELSIGENNDDSQEFKIKNLQLALNQISPKEKAILILKYQDCLSIKEIAHILKLKESAVKMRIKRSKEKLTNLYSNLKVA